MDVFISVIIPIYNVEKYLSKCIESVIAKPYDRMEVILVDDGATDSSGAICDEYKEKYPDVISVIHKKNGGLSDARNYGMKAAKGEYLFFLDSDDFIEEGAIALLAEKLQEFKYPDMLGFCYIWQLENGETKPAKKMSPPAFNQILNSKQNPEIMTLAHNSWLRIVKKKIYTDNQIVFPKGLRYEDMGTTPKLLACCESVVYIPDIIYYYLIREGSIMNTNQIEHYRDMFPIVDGLISWFKEKKVYDFYYNELCYLTYSYVLYASSIAILKHHKYAPLLDELLSYTNSNFKDWDKNCYFKTLPKKKSMSLFMLKHKRYLLLYLLYKATH